MTTIIDEEVEQLWNIAASLRETKKRLSNGEKAVAYIEKNLPFYQLLDKSITDTYKELIQNTEWLAKEFGCLAQIYRDVYSLTKEIDEKIWDKPVMSEEKLKTLLHLGKEGSFTASDIYDLHYEDFDRAADRYRGECRGHSDKEPMRRLFVDGFEERTRNLVEGFKTAIKVSDQADLFMGQIIELLPPLRLQKGRIKVV